jgi:hypothetical protein
MKLNLSRYTATLYFLHAFHSPDRYLRDLASPIGCGSVETASESVQAELRSRQVSSHRFVHFCKLLTLYFNLIVLIDFLIRHGHLTPDNDSNFMDILTRLHGRFDYERW